MTTDKQIYPGTHYFCVDVETSALRVWKGHLLTIGVVVMDGDGNVVDTLYNRVALPVMSESWWNESLPAEPESYSSQAWWREQDQFVKDEAYGDRTLQRFSKQVVAHNVRNLVLSYGETWEDRIFVASPDKFDWMWTETLFDSAGVEDPFWYHAVDMWSFEQGVYSTKRRGSKKGLIDIGHRVKGHEADIPHHALSDAFALAQDLAEYLEKDVIELDSPHYEGYDDYLADQAALHADEQEPFEMETVMVVDDEDFESVLDIESEPEETAAGED